MKTTAEIVVKADLRDLKRLKKEMGDAFNPRGVKDLDRATGDLDSTFSDASETAQDMADALGEATGTRGGFKELRTTIRDVTQEAKKLNAELAKTQQLMSGAGGGGGGGGLSMPSGGGGGGSGGGGRRRRPAGSTPGRSGGSRSGGIMGSAASALEAIPWAGIALGGMVMMAQGAYQNSLERERGRAGSFAARNGIPGGGGGIGVGGIEGVGQAFGLTPGQSHSSYGQFMSRAGKGRTAGEFKLGMGIQQSHGVGLGTTGAMMRAGGRLGTRDPRNRVVKELAAAFTLGLDGSDLIKYMEEQTGIMERQLDIGAQQLNFTATHQEERRMGGIVGGYMGGRITRGFSQGVSEMGYKGGGGATELQLARAAGYNPGDGMESYFKALQKMQDIGSNPEILRGYLQQYMGKKGDNSTIHQRTALIQRALSAIPGMGNIHADTARQIADYTGDNAGLKKIMTGVRTAGSVAGMHGDLEIEAGFATRKADAGRAIAKTMQSIMDSTLKMVETAAIISPILRIATIQIDLIADLAKAAVDNKMVRGIMDFITYVMDFIDDLKTWMGLG